MRNQHPSICSVIPPHVVARVAGHTGDAQSDARTTLQQMRQLAQQRTRAAMAIRPATPEPSGFRKRRSVFDAKQGLRLPGTLVMSERKKGSTDAAVREAFDGAGATFDFLAQVFGRNALDDNGGRIDASVHYGKRFGNAMWNGHQVVYGDGDGRYFHRFTASLDVTGHELMHGVIQHAAALGYSGETGALNEHLCDAFGIMAKQYAARLAARQSDWLIGAELLGPAVRGDAVRSMAAPGTAYDDPILGKDPQPAHMRDYVETGEDNGGVHINSGIPNHAFYLAAIGIGGNAWEVLGQIWYMALTSRLKSDAGFRDLARATVDLAGEMYGNGGRVQRIVSESWGKVGLTTAIFRPRPERDERRSPRRVTAAETPKWRQRPIPMKGDLP
jgi:Zn-dependent metalloprotease